MRSTEEMSRRATRELFFQLLRVSPEHTLSKILKAKVVYSLVLEKKVHKAASTC